MALSPHIVFLGDTDGDDVADRREILYSGFGRYDTHAVHANLHYGVDNWIWATVGYSGGNVDSGGVEHRFKQGLIRFRGDGRADRFTVFVEGLNMHTGLLPARGGVGVVEDFASRLEPPPKRPIGHAHGTTLS